MDRIFTRVMFGLLVIILLGLVLDQSYGDHFAAPRTEAEKRGAIEKTVSGPAVHGIYDPDVVVYATTQLQGIFNESRNYPDWSVSLDDTLLYLVYLLDGSIQFPDKVNFCQRVLPMIQESWGLLDRQALNTQLTERQQTLLDRIKSGYNVAQIEFQRDPACPQPTAGDEQKVRT